MSVEFTTYRTTCGQGRITYREEWSREKPWASYWQGTAGPHFTTVEDAMAYFREKHGARLEA